MPESDPYAPTELLPRSRATEPPVTAAPVFVDTSGRRRRLARRLAIGVLLATGGYALMVVWSLFGGPVAPDTLVPFSPPRSPATSAATVRPSATSDAEARPAPSPRATRGASSSTAGSASTVPSATRSPAAAASATAGHRPSSAPGKPSTTATGHGH